MSGSGARVAAVVACCSLLFTSASADAGAAGKKRKRVESKAYDAPSSAIALGEPDDFYAGVCNPGPTEETEGCLYFDLKPRDRFISIEIEDISGQPVYGIAWDDSDSDFVEFCGHTDKPVPSPGGDYFYVEIIATSNRLGCYPSTATQGTVTVTLSRRR